MEKFTLSHLRALTCIEQVIVHSLEHMIYQVTVTLDDQERLLYTDQGKPYKGQSLEEVRELFEDVQVNNAYLRHDSAYDEMIGQPQRENNRLQVLLGW